MARSIAAAGQPQRRSHRRLISALTAGALLSLAAFGLFNVPPGEVAVVRGRGDASGRVYESGWRWRLPFGASPLRLPLEPIAAGRDFARPNAGGPSLTASVSGRFSVWPGEEHRWTSIAGWQPFLDALWGLLEREIQGRAGDDEPGFGWEAEKRLHARLELALARAGARAEGLVVAMPASKNEPARAAVERKLAELARLTRRKVLLVGWDGGDWLMIRPLLAAGRLPNLKRLIDSGTSGELRSLKPLLSPLLWTTIATGQPAVEHGVADFLVKDHTSEELVPIGSDARRVHALWTILPAFGLRTDVVGWWATWPAEETLGTLVTDRVAYQLFQYRDDPSGAGKVFPPNAWAWVREELVSTEQIGHDDLRRFVEVGREEFDSLGSSLPTERRHENRINHLRKILATTQSYHAVALSLLERQADLTLVYYEGTDTVAHLFARYLPPTLPGVSPEESRRFSRALPEFYAYADELLGQLVARAAPDTIVIVLSDHGFFTGRARPAEDPSDFTTGAPQWHRLHGILIAAGDGIPRGELSQATILDVAPTVLALLGLPVPRDMKGQVLKTLLPPAQSRNERRLASYQVLPRPAQAKGQRSPAADQERLRELAALGYISLDTVGEGQRLPAGRAASAPDTQALATEAYNLGRIHQQKGELEVARGQYRNAIARLPSFGVGYAALAQTASLQGKHAEAFDVLTEGFRHSGSMPLSGLTGLVDEAKHAGRLPEAEAILLGLASRYEDQGAYHAALGLLEEELGRIEPALEHYERALAIDSVDQLAIERAIAILRRRGREAEARQRLAAGMARARGSLGSLNHLAVVCLRQGWPRDAEQILRGVLESDPGSPGVLSNLAASLAQQGRAAEAAGALVEALRREPDNAQNHFNLGAILAGQGRSAEALASFEKAHESGLRGLRVRVAMAKMRFRLGDRAKSRSELQEALRAEPDNPEALELLRILGQ